MSRFRGQLALCLHVGKKSLFALWADNCLTQSAAISYYLIVSIFPLMLLIIGIAGFFLEPRQVQSQLLDWLHQYFPAGASEVFRKNIRATIEARNSVSVFGFIGLIWSSTLMFDAVNEAVNAAWGTREKVRFLTGKLKSLILILIFFLAISVSTFLTTQFALVSRFSLFMASLPGMKNVLDSGREALSWVLMFVPFVISVFAFGLAYRLLPQVRTTARDVWPAAIAAAILWEISKRIFVWYVVAHANYAQIYGPISAVLILMLWAYVSSLILSWGAELAAETWKIRRNLS
jgi:membrane protein